MSMDCETGALIECFGTFGIVDVGSGTTIGTGAAILTTMGTPGSLLTPALDESVVELETCDSPGTVGTEERLLVMKACSILSL